MEQEHHRPDLEAQLRHYFGFTSFRPLQKEIVQEVMAGRNAVAILPTGAGKSLCYQLPALLSPGLAIVISPLISLMKDQVDSLVQRGVAAIAITSHDTAEEGRSKLAALSRGEVKLVFAAPERLQNQSFLAAVKSAQVPVSLLAVDEAHCVSQWGHDFRPEYRQIPDFHAAIGRPPLLALTATARVSVQSDLQQQLGIADAHLFKASADRPNLWFGVDHCQSEAEREAKLVHIIGKAQGSAILYVTSRKDADQWARTLSDALSEQVLCYHGGMGAEERTSVQNRFMTDQVRVVVATNAFGMGIDKPDIRLVIHAGVPDSLEAYFQEVGRAGRDGHHAECRMVLVPGRDVKIREHLMAQSATDEPTLQRFRQMRIYVYLKEQCRRTYLLRYFGENTAPKPEDCCSACHPRLVEVEPVVRTRTRKAARQTKPVSGAVPAMPAHPLSGSIMERLKTWRRQVAAGRGVPAFVIFGDRDLEAVASVAPRDLAELSACRGVGPTKLREYGEAVLGEVAAVLASHGDATPARQLPDVGAEDADQTPRKRVSRISNQETSAAHFTGGRTVEQVAGLMQLAPTTVFGYFLEWLAVEPSAAWKQAVRQFLSPDSYRAIRSTMLAQEDGRLRLIFDALGGRYSYEEIRVAKVVLERTGR